MNLDVSFCVKQLEQCGFEKIDTEKGSFIKLPLLDAIRFSLIQGSCFLNNCVGTTLKGRSEVFIHRAIFQNDSLIYTPGLFGRDINGHICEGNSLFSINKKFPEIFKGKHKYIYPVQLKKDERSNQEQQYFEIFSKLYLETKKDYFNPTNILLFKISDNGSNLEPFFEYLTSNYFHKLGYVTENQVPWFQQKYNSNGKMINGGIPDFSSFHFTFLTQLSKEGLFSEGMPMEEFGLLFLNGISKPNNKVYEYDLKIGEVKVNKSSKPQILKQLSQYNQTRLPDELFGIIPDEVIGFDNFGLMNFIDGLKFYPKRAKDVDSKLREKDDEWFKIYVKTILLSNFDIQIVRDFLSKHTRVSSDKITSKEILNTVVHVDDLEFINFIKEQLKNGLH